MLRKMLTDPVKYITVDGTPAGYPFILRHLLRADFLAATATAATLSVISISSDARDKSMPPPAIFFAMGVNYALNNVFEARSRRKLREKFDQKIINTQPSPEELAYSFKYRLKAREEAREACIEMVGGAVAVGIMTALAPEAYVFFSMAAATMITDSAAKAFRFKMVSDGKWAIVDDQPKEKLLEHFKPAEREITALPQPA